MLDPPKTCFPNLSIASLPDDRVLALCDWQMDDRQQASLSDLLARNREGQLARSGREQLDALMQIYRRGLVCKAKAFKVAVSRGLRTMEIELTLWVKPYLG